MKSKLLKTAIVLMASVSLSACLATRQEIRQGVRSEPPSAEQQSQANNEVRYEELEEQMRKMLGRIETLENNLSQMNAEKTGGRSELISVKKSTDEKLKVFEDAMTKLEKEQLALDQKVEALKVAHAAAAEAAAKESKPTAGGAKKAFEAGEVEFQKKKYKEAIVSFQKYRDTNPTGKHYAEATYKIGVCFHDLGMKAEAKSFYSEVAEKYPHSEWAKKASGKLKSLK